MTWKFPVSKSLEKGIFPNNFRKLLVNQLTGFYIRATLALNGLNKPKKANSNSGGVKYNGYCSQLKFTSTKKQKYSLYVQYIVFFFLPKSYSLPYIFEVNNKH